MKMIPVRFTDAEVKLLDDYVALRKFRNRSDGIRRLLIEAAEKTGKLKANALDEVYRSDRSARRRRTRN